MIKCSYLPEGTAIAKWLNVNEMSQADPDV